VLAGILVAAAILASQTSFFASARKNSDPLTEMKSAVVYEFVDPNSAQFRNVRKSTFRYCGEVNSKNLMGGYVGFQNFEAIQDASGRWVVSFQKEFVDIFCREQ